MKCLSSMRLFDSIDDGVRVATSGIEWKITEFNVVVLFIATLGYYRYNTSPRSVKDEDTRVTHVIVRDSKFSSDKPLRDKRFKRVTAVKLFRDTVIPPSRQNKNNGSGFSAKSGRPGYRRHAVGNQGSVHPCW